MIPKWRSFKKLDLTTDSGDLLGNTKTGEKNAKDIVEFLYSPKNWKTRDYLVDKAIRWAYSS